jgi:hypothetical protein
MTTARLRFPFMLLVSSALLLCIGVSAIVSAAQLKVSGPDAPVFVLALIGSNSSVLGGVGIIAALVITIRCAMGCATQRRKKPPA